MRRWLERIPYSRVLTILGVTAGVSLGLCGTNTFVAMIGGRAPQGPFTLIIAIFATTTLVASLVGMVLVGLLALVASMLRPPTPVVLDLMNSSSKNNQDDPDGNDE